MGRGWGRGEKERESERERERKREENKENVNACSRRIGRGVKQALPSYLLEYHFRAPFSHI